MSSRNHPFLSSVPSTQRGLSLVEVMVAMTIGLLLLIGLGTLLLGTSRSFKVQDNFARMQDNAAYALNTLGSNIRMAGFVGYASSGEIQDGVLSGMLDDSTNPCIVGAGKNNWIVNTEGVLQDATGLKGIEAVFGYAGRTSATVAGALGCVSAQNFVDNSPIVVLRGANGIRVPVADLVSDRVYIQSDSAASVLFMGAEYAALPGDKKKWVFNAAGAIVEAPVYEYQSVAYYIRPCSRPSGAAGTLCTATDDGGRPVPTLVRQELAGANTATGETSMGEFAVAEGIERMSVLYGVDNRTPRDGVPDQYVAVPAADQWAQVVAVRVAVLARSPLWQHDYDDGDKTYDLGGGVNFTCAGENCHYHRHVFAQTFQVRNLAQRVENSI